MIPVWHGHHNTLVSFLDSIEERIVDIEANKPVSEHALRKRLLKPVKGDLPAEVVATWQAYGQAWKAYRQAWKAYGQAWKAYGQAEEACYQARQAYGQAEEACGQAEEAYGQTLKDHQTEIEALHAVECPDCPWDGRTIFPEDEGVS